MYVSYAADDMNEWRAEQRKNRKENRLTCTVNSISVRLWVCAVCYACVCVYWCYFSFRTLQCATLNSVDIPNRVARSTCERAFCCGENECVWKNLCRMSKTTAELWLIEKRHLTVVHATTLRKMFCNKIRLFIFFFSLFLSGVWQQCVFVSASFRRLQYKTLPSDNDKSIFQNGQTEYWARHDIWSDQS